MRGCERVINMINKGETGAAFALIKVQTLTTSTAGTLSTMPGLGTARSDDA